MKESKKTESKKTESKNDARLLLPLYLLYDACKVAPCYSWDDCDAFRDVKCDNCPIMAAINFLKGDKQ